MSAPKRAAKAESSTSTVVVRPVWRKVRPRYLAFAAAHVRAGGLAVVAPESGPLTMILAVDEHGKLTELARWALLAIEQRIARVVTTGPAKGLRSARVHPRFAGAVLDWCERDRVHEGATRRLELDCTRCAACCHDADVVLDDRDLDRWRKAGRSDLAAPLFVRRARDGRVTLRFASSGRCQHLGDDERCGIYAVRPDNCRAFVVGSEACLAAREDTLGLRDDS